MNKSKHHNPSPSPSLPHNEIVAMLSQFLSLKENRIVAMPSQFLSEKGKKEKKKENYISSPTPRSLISFLSPL
jgi:hypothetical protein